MGKEIRAKSKIIFKHKLEVDWLASDYIPEQGEQVIYDIEVDKDGNVLELPEGRTEPYVCQRIKYGDGIHTVSDLPFTYQTEKDLKIDDKINKITRETLEEAKNSGEFKGEPGEKGEKGADGQPGKDGADGEDGKDGLTPFINDYGSWQIGEADTGVKAAGQDGQDGKDGIDGKDGEPGQSGVYIGETEPTEDVNVWICPIVDTTSFHIAEEAERVSKAVQATRTAKSLVFPIMSDAHLYAGNSNHDASLVSAQLAGMGVRELQKRMHLDFVGYLGDYSYMSSSGNYTVEQVKADITAFKMTTNAKDKEIWCVGNHDLNYGRTSDRLMTLEEMYSYIGANSDGIKPYESIERGYGYLDFENQKIRVIYLNTCDASDWDVTEGEDARSEWISPTQIQWLADDALDFTDKTAPTEWGIVIVGHHPLHYSYGCFRQVMQLLEAYKDGLSGALSCTVKTETVDGTITYIQQRVDYDFSSVERAEIICNIHGHNHNCGASKISSTTMLESPETGVTPWLWRFCIPNLCYGRYNEAATNDNEKFKNLYGEFDENGNPVYWEKETGTAKATSFCVVNIDRKNKKIYAHFSG